MDAAGKDSVIKHVMTGLNPQGVEVHPFKQPSAEELNHDFLWRAGMRLPARGRIGIFNRSHYEDVLVGACASGAAGEKTIAAGAVWQGYLAAAFRGYSRFRTASRPQRHVILKFFLNVSKDEQRKRFLDRIKEPGKRWKFSMNDVVERKLWAKYMAAFESPATGPS